MSFSSDELNLLIHRYLIEAGYDHSAFVFGSESKASNVENGGREVPYAALIKILQRGMFYAESELIAMVPNATEAAQVLKERLTLFDAAEEKEALRYKMREVAQQAADQYLNASNNVDVPSTSAETAAPNVKPEVPAEAADASRAQVKTPQANNNTNNRQNGYAKKGQKAKAAEPQEAVAAEDAMPPIVKKQMAATAASSENLNGALAPATLVDLNNLEIGKDRVKVLKKHFHEVFICSWSPKEDVLASGSGDSTARLWKLHSLDNVKAAENESLVLRHYLGTLNAETKPANKDVTSIDWHKTGDKIATGCYDGFARIWDTTNGSLMTTLGSHKGPVFALRWSPSGDYVLSAGVDKSTNVWDTISRKHKQQFQFHEASALDVDWVSDDSFASCSTDAQIHVCKMGMATPLRTYRQHTSEVNAVRYDQYSNRLASCSDDKTIKIWSLDADEAIHSFDNHTREIYTIRWSPVGHILASASFDQTVRLWEADQGREKAILHGHTDPVYSIAFGPNGNVIASGSFDRSVIIWDCNSARPVTVFKGSKAEGGVFEISINRTGEKLAACTSDGAIILLDLRFLKRAHDGTVHPLSRLRT
ncbi:unnamed protein product, partial [Mesorhabditis spiculigera]